MTNELENLCGNDDKAMNRVLRDMVQDKLKEVKFKNRLIWALLAVIIFLISLLLIF